MPDELSSNRFDVTLQHDWSIEQCLLHIRVFLWRENEESMGAIHSTKLSGNFGPKLNGSVRSNLKSFEKTGPPFEVDPFSSSFPVSPFPFVAPAIKISGEALKKRIKRIDNREL